MLASCLLQQKNLIFRKNKFLTCLTKPLGGCIKTTQFAIRSSK